MKILKRVLIGIGIIIAIPLISAIFIKKDFAVEREIVINKPKPQVFDYIKLVKNQDNYSVWAKKDPNMNKVYTGTDGTVGFISAWDSKNDEVGKGEQEIVKIAEGEKLDMKLRFKTPFEIEDDAYFITESVTEDQTKVKWGFKGHTPYPMNFICLFINMDKMIGKDLSDGLTNLKGILEK